LAHSNAPDVGKRSVLKGSLVELDKEGKHRLDVHLTLSIVDPSLTLVHLSVVPLVASPAGWHHVPSESKGGEDIFYYETRGNNVLAQDNLDGGNSMNGFRANGGKKMEFDFAIHMPKAGTPLDPHCRSAFI